MIQNKEAFINFCNKILYKYNNMTGLLINFNNNDYIINECIKNNNFNKLYNINNNDIFIVNNINLNQKIINLNGIPIQFSYLFEDESLDFLCINGDLNENDFYIIFSTFIRKLKQCKLLLICNYLRNHEFLYKLMAKKPLILFNEETAFYLK